MTRPGLCNMLAKGKGPLPVLVGNRRMFHEDAVREWKRHYELNLKRRRRNSKD